jgi:hypothetical protein
LEVNECIPAIAPKCESLSTDGELFEPQDEVVFYLAPYSGYAEVYLENDDDFISYAFGFDRASGSSAEDIVLVYEGDGESSVDGCNAAESGKT